MMHDNPRRTTPEEVAQIEAALNQPVERQRQILAKKIAKKRKFKRLYGNKPIEKVPLNPVSAEEWRLIFEQRGMAVKRVYFNRVPPRKTVSATGNRITHGVDSLTEQYYSQRKELVRQIVESAEDDLRRAGLSQSDIDIMRERGTVPRGWDLHHKLPISGGGDPVSLDNLVLIKRDPYHEDIHRHLDLQVQGMSPNKGGRKLVELAVPEGLVYVPPYGDPGIRARHDAARMQQQTRRAPEPEYTPKLYFQMDGPSV